MIVSLQFDGLDDDPETRRMIAASFAIEQVPVFNTNTLLIDTTAVRPDYPLTWFRADRTIRWFDVERERLAVHAMLAD